MVSSLAAQLAQGASNNTHLLTDRSKRKFPDSYLFDPREAEKYSLDTVRALALNGLAQLRSLSPALADSEFDEESLLFAQVSVGLDRTLLSSERGAEVDGMIGRLLGLLGPYVVDPPTGKVLEWLVQRFRIHVFNVPEVLELFLPYHESPHFIKMLSILQIKDQTPWSFLLPYKSASKSPLRSTLATEMQKNADLARFVASLLSRAISSSASAATGKREGEGAVHRTLLNFHTSVLLEFISRSSSKGLDAGTLGYLLPCLVEPLKVEVPVKGRKDLILSCYVLLSALSQKCSFTLPALVEIITSMIHAAHNVDTTQLMSALISVLSPQMEIVAFSDSIVDSLLGLKNLRKAIQASMAWSGIEKVLCPMVPNLDKHISDDSKTSLLEYIIALSDVPEELISKIQETLADSILAGTLSPEERAQKTHLVSMIRQRYPALMEAYVKRVSTKNDIAPEALDYLLLELSMPSSTAIRKTRKEDMILASYDSDPSVRAIGVREILTILSAGKVLLKTEEISSMHDALRARFEDANTEVIEALYSAPQTLLTLIPQTNDFLQILNKALNTEDLPRSILRLHLAFLCNEFSTANPGRQAEVLIHVLLDHLIFTKSRQKSIVATWEIVRRSVIAKHQLLRGALEIVNARVEEAGARSVEDMADINKQLVEKIGQNIVSSNEYNILLDWLVERSKSTRQSSKLFSLLVLRALIEQLSGTSRAEVGLRVLRSVEVGILSQSSKASSLADQEGGETETELFRNVVVKPNGQSTLQRAIVNLLTHIASTPISPEVTIHWFSNESNVYSDLFRLVYHISQSSSVPTSLGKTLARSTFLLLGSNCLLFLTSIWVNALYIPSSAVEGISALRHAGALLQAQRGSQTVDFQVIVPALVCALSSEDARVRVAALQCVEELRNQAAGSDAEFVYGLDNVYGSSSDALRYIEWEDVAKYTDMLSQHKNHIENDSRYVAILHAEHFSPRKGEDKKIARYKQRILCYLLSHSISCPSLHMAINILEILHQVSDSVKLETLLPSIKTHLTQVGNVQSDAKLRLQYLTIALNVFDSSVAKDLNNEKSEAWPVMMKAWEQSYTLELRRILSTTLEAQLRAGLFNALTTSRQTELCLALLKLSVSNNTQSSKTQTLLRGLIQKTHLVANLLKSLQHSLKDPAQRTLKRARLEDEGQARETDQADLSALVLLAETLSFEGLPSSVEVLGSLFETLSKVVASSSPEDATYGYLEQVLMSCIDVVGSKIQSPVEIPTGAIKLDVLVDLVRQGSNSQTFNQALLLLSNLTRLDPEAVLRNIMPIFTFMGSNVFHRDDTYSFQVIQKTTENIIPIMVTSLKENNTDRLQLYIASRGFLRVFTDAATHVPRHRRTTFFTHLVDVLGPAEFLAPVCMMLTDKFSNRVARQGIKEAHAQLALPLAILHHYSVGAQIQTLDEILAEVLRILDTITDASSSVVTVLEAVNDDEHDVPIMKIKHRQCLALLSLAGHCLSQLRPSAKPAEQIQSGPLVSKLLEIASGPHSEAMKLDSSSISSSANWVLSKLIGISTPSDFALSIVLMLNSGKTSLQKSALELFADRLHSVSEDHRKEISPSVSLIIDFIRNTLQSQEHTSLLPASLASLRSIVSTAPASEADSLTKLIPAILDVVRLHPKISGTFAIISSMTSLIGPRIIPNLRQIVLACVAAYSTSPDDCHATLTATLSVASSFWGAPELKAILAVYLNPVESAEVSSKLGSLMKTIAKRVPSKIIIQTLLSMWTEVNEDSQKIIRYLQFMKRALHASSRAEILSQLRSLFTLFMEAFGLRGKLATDDVIEVEDSAISSFLELTIKLNEAAFQPLFRRFFDWAFADNSTDDKKITFGRTYAALLDLLKDLMTQYMSFLLSPLVDLFDSYRDGKSTGRELWATAMKMLLKSIEYDDGVFWRDDRLQAIFESLVPQIPLSVTLRLGEDKALLSSCLTAIADSTEDNTILKSINLQTLMQTRSEDARVRLFALSCAVELWQNQARKLAGFVPETSTFIVECAEDENDDIMKEALKLKNAVEVEAGKIDGL